MGMRKGQTNNPNGRPPKGRALAEQILKALDKKRTDSNGKKRAGKEIFGEMLASAVLTGEAVLLGGRKTELPPREWIELVKFVSVHVDGTASKSELEAVVKTDKVEAYDYNSAIAALAPRPDENSESSGEDKNDSDGAQVGQNTNGG